MRNRGNPGDLYRLEGDAIPERIRAKNSLAPGGLPRGADPLPGPRQCPADRYHWRRAGGLSRRSSLVLTPTVQAQIEPVIRMVLAELDRLGVSYRRRTFRSCASRSLPKSLRSTTSWPSSTWTACDAKCSLLLVEDAQVRRLRHRACRVRDLEDRRAGGPRNPGAAQGGRRPDGRPRGRRRNRLGRVVRWRRPIEAKRLLVNGIVQGVGFRPFVYQLARAPRPERGGRQHVHRGGRSTSRGPPSRCARLNPTSPKKARRRSRTSSRSRAARTSSAGYPELRITHSRGGCGHDHADLAGCGRLRATACGELFDPADRRYPLPLHQLHQLRPALHHHRRHPLRPAQDLHAALHHVRRRARPSTTTRSTAASTPSPTPARSAGRRSACGSGRRETG